MLEYVHDKDCQTETQHIGKETSVEVNVCASLLALYFTAHKHLQV